MSRSDKYVKKAIGTLYTGDKERCPISPNAPYPVWRSYGAIETRKKYPFKTPEILAPASVSTYKTAVLSGANAIYFGYGELNARAGAENFSDLTEVVDFCHLHNVKAYLTLNVMLKDGELSEAKKIILAAEQAKIDAFIISDLALLPLIRRHSSAAIHASTQMGVHNSAGAKFLEKLGFDRVVLSREITEKELVDILDNTEIEVETFVHGALCIAFSGACLFSALLTGKSGNRGRCAQLCRRFYSCEINGKPEAKGYLLSAKDICMASLYPVLSDLNVDSLKIEGRLKGPEYVATVTRTYADLQKGVSFDKETEDRLKICFNRGNYTRGYWDGKDVVFPYFPNHIGLRCGRVVKIVSKNLVAVLSTRPLKKGDFLKVTRGTNEIGGMEVTGEKKFLDGKEVFVCHNPNDGVRVDDVVSITKRDENLTLQRKNVVEYAVRLVGGEGIHLIATCDGVLYEKKGPVVDRAQNAPLRVEDVKTAFSKSGDDFSFVAQEIVVSDAFMPKKDLNELRREVIAYFTDKKINEYERPKKKKLGSYKTATKVQGDFAEFESVEQLSDLVCQSVKNIVYSPQEYDLEEAKRFYDATKTDNNAVWIKFPIFLPSTALDAAREYIDVFDGAVAQNFGVAQLCVEKEKPYVAGWAMNVANGKNPLLNWAAQTVLSVELKMSEVKEISKNREILPLVYAFGKLPLMYLSFCPKRLIGRTCDECNERDKVVYKDQKGEYDLSPKRFEGACSRELRNSSLTVLGDFLPNPRYFDFCGFTKKEIETFFKKYFSEGGDVGGFNHLCLSKGVE